MKLKLIKRVSAAAAVGLTASVLTAAAAGASPQAAAVPSATATLVAASHFTTTPIKHVVVIIGENHSFDNVFATYQPPKGQHIWNLRSKGIVTTSGNPPRPRDVRLVLLSHSGIPSRQGGMEAPRT